MSVYFITARDIGRVKIGCAKNVRARLATLQTASSLELKLEATLSGYTEVERELHARFAQHKIRGEWFALVGEIDEFIKSTGSTDGDDEPLECTPRRPTIEELIEESLRREHETYAECMAWRDRLDRGLMPELQP